MKSQFRILEVKDTYTNNRVATLGLPKTSGIKPGEKLVIAIDDKGRILLVKADDVINPDAFSLV